MLLRPSTCKSKYKYKLSAHRSKDALGARTGVTVDLVDVAWRLQDDKRGDILAAGKRTSLSIKGE